MTFTLRVDCEGEQDFCLAVDCQLPAQGVSAIYGPSGSGKTTLLDCIAGLRQPAPGSSIKLGDTDWCGSEVEVPAWKRRIGYVFNNARLFPHLTVEQNLRYAQKRARGNTFLFEQVVEWLKLEGLLSRNPETLSAGQAQRVAIGRALMSAPRLLLLDEPFANLDSSAATQCLLLLQQLSQETNLPMLFVSHDIEEVSSLADYLVLLDSGQVLDHGPLLEMCGKLDSSLSRDERAAAIVQGSVKDYDAHYGLTELQAEGQSLFIAQNPGQQGDSMRVRIPARDVSICRKRPDDSSILNILAVTISEIADSDGPRVMLRLALGSQYLLARITLKSAELMDLKQGDTVYAQVKSAALLSAGHGHS